MRVFTNGGCATAIGDRDFGGAALLRGSALVDVGMVDCGYLVYTNCGAGVVDFATPVARLSTNTRHWRSGSLTHPGNWRFAVRAYNAQGSERNLDRQALLRLDAGGELEPARPTGVTGLAARARADGKVELGWSHDAGDEATTTTHFHVYHDDGTGRIDYGSPSAEIARAPGPVAHHVWLSEALREGVVHRFAVRAASAEDVEDDGTQTVEATPITDAPEQPIALTGYVIH